VEEGGRMSVFDALVTNGELADLVVQLPREWELWINQDGDITWMGSRPDTVSTRYAVLNPISGELRLTRWGWAALGIELPLSVAVGE
jgi:hypothetical protein